MPGPEWNSTDPACSAAGETLYGTKNSGEQWVHGDNSQANKPVASEVCVSITWTGSNDCGSRLGTVVGTKTDGNCDDGVTLGWSAAVWIDTSGHGRCQATIPNVPDN